MGGKFWALQAGTSHNLGDHFARVYGIPLRTTADITLPDGTGFASSRITVGSGRRSWSHPFNPEAALTLIQALTPEEMLT